MADDTTHFIRATSLTDLQEAGCMTMQLNGHTVVLFAQSGGHVFAVDNRCPHMGFPLKQGTVKDGILTCHWHHARFDLESGGTFDQWADDVRVFPTEIRQHEVWVDVGRKGDPLHHQRERLRVGLERDLSLVIGKAVLVLAEAGDVVEPFRVGLKFGVTYRQNGWGQGLTILTALMNILPHLEKTDQARALYKGLSAVADDCFREPPRFPVSPLPAESADFATLKRWFRRFIEVRDSEGAERCLVSAIRTGATSAQMAEMLFSAVTDHRYIQTGHPADFTNKAFEALDIVGWQHAEIVLTGLLAGYANAARMEEANEWRNPIDLVELLEAAFEKLPAIVETGRKNRDKNWAGREELVPILLHDDPHAIVDALVAALAAGCTEIELAETVSYAAALRIARFHTSNEFGDWDTALHTFTFANAIEQGLRRTPAIELLRGVFDAAMSVYLDRFLNIPAAHLPQPNGQAGSLDELQILLDRQQQVNQAGEKVAHYLYGGGAPEKLLAMLGGLLLREDRDFHTIQSVEAAFKQYQRLRDTEAGNHILIAAARYLAAHSPTMRAEEQTYQIAYRLHRGDRLFEE